MNSKVLALACAMAFAAVPSYGATAFTGTITATFAVKIVTPPASGDDVYCTLTADLIDTETVTPFTSISYTEVASGLVVATAAGTTVYCSVQIPYYWLLNNQAHDTFSLGYTVGYVSTNALTGLSILKQERQSSSSVLGKYAVPASGMDTHLGVHNVTL